MKITTKIILFLFSVATFIYGCSKSNSTPELPEKPEEKPKAVLDTYTYLRKEVIEFKVYKGSSKGGIDVSATEKPESYWNSTKLADYFYDTLTVTKDSILERPWEYEINDFRYEQRKDSVFRWNRYADFWEFYGLKKGDTLEHYVCFYNFHKNTPPFASGVNGHNSGEVKYSNYFNNEAPFFKGPEDMKNEYDQVAWYNIKYIFVKKK